MHMFHSPWFFVAFQCTRSFSDTHTGTKQLPFSFLSALCVGFDQLIKGHLRRNLLIGMKEVVREVCSLRAAGA